ncbi:hypothetical protein M9H77_27834 [Catharanthus roseus]|uniref:Uncharacterized protein n=1 Tax=Catharanthus roseus TaxID=4058 RepID=A0ACC0AHT7_CATRO|nr:hypothetical protein M9H77_27834 [Catharanthus roseus]
MPRTTTVDIPGCPPLRALTFDVLGLIKVIEAKGAEKAHAQVVERWGEPDSSRGLLASSIIDRELDPLLGVARKNGLVEILSPINGGVQASVSNINQAGTSAEDDAIVGLYLFRRKQLESSSRSCTFLTCTIKGNTIIRSIEVPRSQNDTVNEVTQTTWATSGSGDILCSKVDESENFALFGGKRVEMNLWDLESNTKVWTAKSPAKNSLGIFTPTWFTSTTFLNKDDHRKFVSGTNDHQVRLYDISAQRRPVMSLDFRETPIKALAEDLDGNKIYVGNGSGDLASFDIRTGKLLGSFLGKCSGSIRSIVRHRERPVIASCGLDGYLRIWDIDSRQLLSAVFLKQHLMAVVFDSYFRNEEVAFSSMDLPPEAIRSEEEDIVPAKRKKKSKTRSGSKKHSSGKRNKKSDLE